MLRRAAARALNTPSPFARALHPPPPIFTPCPPQSSDPAVLNEWPAALHLLGHIYNENL